MRRKWICAAGLIALAGVVACGSGTPNDQTTSAGGKTSTNVDGHTHTGNGGNPGGGSDGSTNVDGHTHTGNGGNPGGGSGGSTNVDGHTHTGNGGNPGSGSGTSTEVDVLLAQQITLLGGGDGVGIDCRRDLQDGVVQPAQHPDVWISPDYADDPDRPTDVTLTRTSGLCLLGFADDESIEIQVQVGTAVYNTTVVPTPTAPSPEFPEYEAPETLFLGGGLTVQHPPVFDGQVPEPDPVLQSGMWKFLPPLKIRDAMAETGSLKISATQAGSMASRTQAVVLPTTPDRIWLEYEAHELAFLGFAPGQVMDVGLYELTGEFGDGGEIATLVGSIGTVEIPPSRVAVFKVPADVVASVADGAVEHCVTVGPEERVSCPRL